MSVTTSSLENRDPAVTGRYPPGAEDHSAQIGAALAELRRELEIRSFVWTRFAGVDSDGVYDGTAGTNGELDMLHELKALELIHRSLSETAGDRWERAALYYQKLFTDRLQALTFATYDRDADGTLDTTDATPGYRAVKATL